MKTGDVIGYKYLVGGVLSESAMRQKYLGENIDTHERVIIETVHDTMLDNDSAIMGLKYEIELSKKLSEPYFMGYIDTVTQGSRLFLIWKYVDATPLTNNEAISKLTFRQICIFISKATQALIVAHRKGVIHGALSTDVILITPTLEPIIIGFMVPGVEPITDPGILGGISAYRAAAPELFQGEQFDESCDFYSLGVIANFVLHSINPKYIDNSRKETVDTISLISRLRNSDRYVRILSAERIADTSFLDEMATPPSGNEAIVLSKKEIRRVKKSTAEYKPRNENRQMLYSFFIKFLVISSLGLSALLFVVYFFGSK